VIRDAISIESLFERFSFVERHGDEELTILGLVDIVDGAVA
jgi:hypothetical protein